MPNPGNVESSAPEESKTLIEQEGEIPETVEVIEEKALEAEEPVEGEASEQEKAEEPKPEKKANKPWFQTRIDQITRQKNEEREARLALEARLAALEKPQEGDDKPAFKPEQFEALIEQRAEAKLAEREHMRRANAWVQSGQKEYGPAEFDSMCADVAAMGAGDSKEFMQIVTDPDVIPDGHRVIAALRDDPDQAQRILAMEPIKMAAALTRLASTSKPKAPETPISKAPKPTQTIGGSAKTATLSDDQDMKTWLANRNKTARMTAGGKPNTH